MQAKEESKSRFSSRLPSILSGKLSDEEYGVLLANLSREPMAGRIADFAAASPLMFVLIHEAGHHFGATREVAISTDLERSADQFTMRVFDANEMSPTIAMSFLQLSYFEALSADARAISCRIVEIVNHDRDVSIAFGRGALTQMKQRLNDL